MSGKHDAQIRVRLLGRIHAERPRSFIVQEWAFLTSIADVGVIGDGAVDAFEIKSAHDSTARLVRQAADYSRVFSRCTLVAARAHLRAAANNPVPNLAELLWSAEAEKLIRALGRYPAALERERQQAADYVRVPWTPRVPSRASRSSLVATLAGAPDLAGAVCTILRARQHWRLPGGRSVRGQEIRDMRAANARRITR